MGIGIGLAQAGGVGLGLARGAGGNDGLSEITIRD